MNSKNKKNAGYIIATVSLPCNGIDRLFSNVKLSSGKPPDLILSPSEDQIVAIGDSLTITCRTTSERKRSLYWGKNKKPLPNYLQVSKFTDGEKIVTTVIFKSIKWNDGGTYFCHGDEMIPKEITVRVVTGKRPMCSRDVMTVGHDQFLWPVTLGRTAEVASCPWPNDRGDINVDTHVRRTCNEKGVWGQINIGNCQLVPLSKKLVLLPKVMA